MLGRMRCRAGILAHVAFAACLLQDNPAFDTGSTAASGGGEDSSGTDTGVPGCDGDRFAFVVVTDHPEGQDASLDRVLAEIIGDHPDVHFVLGAGDMTTFESVWTRIAAAPWDERCGPGTLPYFPAFGHDEAQDPATQDWLRTYVATSWVDDPGASPLARQLPAISGFRRGPVSVQHDDGNTPVPHGSIYAFDYRGVHFAITNAYVPGVVNDATAGVFDSGPDGEHVDVSQLDWLRDDLATNTAPLSFVVGHVPLAYVCYGDPVACPDIPVPPGASEHNGEFHTAALTDVLVEHGVAAWFHGHDEVASRLLLDRTREILHRRAYWEVVDEPAPDPEAWESLQGPGAVWQVDAGRVDDSGSYYVVVTVEPARVHFAIHAYADGLNDGATVLWDEWELPR
jgi:hypothetical protein